MRIIGRLLNASVWEDSDRPLPAAIAEADAAEEGPRNADNAILDGCVIGFADGVEHWNGDGL